MDSVIATKSSENHQATIDDVHRLLALGQLLLSVLTPEEIKSIETLLKECPAIKK